MPLYYHYNTTTHSAVNFPEEKVVPQSRQVQVVWWWQKKVYSHRGDCPGDSVPHTERDHTKDTGSLCSVIDCPIEEGTSHSVCIMSPNTVLCNSTVSQDSSGRQTRDLPCQVCNQLFSPSFPLYSSRGYHHSGPVSKQLLFTFASHVYSTRGCWEWNSHHPLHRQDAPCSCYWSNAATCSPYLRECIYCWQSVMSSFPSHIDRLHIFSWSEPDTLYLNTSSDMIFTLTSIWCTTFQQIIQPWEFNWSIFIKKNNLFKSPASPASLHTGLGLQAN